MATNFLNRWSQRKLEQGSDTATDTQTLAEETPLNETIEHITASDSIDDTNNSEEGVNEPITEPIAEPNSVAALLASEAEAAVKKAALRKLFLSGEFSEVDRLNDYDHDYKSVRSLSSEAASKLREWINEEPEQDDADSLSANNTDEETYAQAEPDISVESTQEDAPLEADSVGQNIPHEK